MSPPAAPPLDLPALIKEIGRGARGARDLSREQAAALFGAMLDGEVDELRLGAIVLALRVKGESVDELLGFHDAMQARVQRLQHAQRVVLLPTLNGARKLLNLMPLLALHLAQQGVPVLVHGRNDFGAARGDTFALFAALGHPRCTTLAEAQERLNAHNLAVLPTALLCPGLDRLMALRPRLGLRNSAHTMAKLLDPFHGHSVRVAAVTHGDFLDALASVLPQLDGPSLLLKGCEGEAYPHPRRQASLQAFVGGEAVALVLGDVEDAALWETQGEASAEAQKLLGHLSHGAAAWPTRLAEMVVALGRLASMAGKWLGPDRSTTEVAKGKT
ncbi:MAG: DNA-binding protein YbiB [Inhella sp.]